MDTLNDLLAASDLISLHCALTNDTIQILNADCLQHIKPGKLLIVFSWRFSVLAYLDHLSHEVILLCRGIPCKYWEQPAAGWLCCETTFNWRHACRLCPGWCRRATMDGSMGMMSSIRVWMHHREVVQMFALFLVMKLCWKLHEFLLDRLSLILGCQSLFFWRFVCCVMFFIVGISLQPFHLLESVKMNNFL